MYDTVYHTGLSQGGRMISIKDRIACLAGVLEPRRVQRMYDVLQQRTRHITVVLEDLHHEHNISAVARSAECFGIQDLYIVEANNQYSMSTGVSRGSTDWLTLHRYHQAGAPNMQRCAQDLKQRGYTLVGTSPHTERTLADISLDTPIALVFGTELTGMSDHAYQAVDYTVKVPMYGFTESFNVSVTVAVCLYDLTTRLRAHKTSWQLSEQEQDELLLTWLRSHTKRSADIEREYERLHALQAIE